MENPPKKFFRLSPGREVRLRYAYFVTCREVVKDAAGEVVGAALHLRSGDHAAATRPTGARCRRRCIGSRPPMRCRPRCGSTTRCSRAPDPGAGGDVVGRPQSALAGGAARLPASSRRSRRRNAGEAVQFERQGYFCPDPDSTPQRLVFNRTVGLRDTWAKVSAGG